jgi:ParB-like chromosome segregation protein Spo0J
MSEDNVTAVVDVVGKFADDLRGLLVPLGDCYLDPANARTGHDIERIAGSLAAYGQRKPIVVNVGEGGKIEAGNGTWQAARLLGWSHIAAVRVNDDPMTAVAYGIADNRTGDLSAWDGEALAVLLEALEGSPELPTGFEEGELEALLAELGQGDEAGGAGDGEGGSDAEPQTSRADELQEKWGTAVGQLWQIGEHRLLIGDCTVGENMARLMAGEKAVLIHADPPYGMGKEKDGIANDNLYRDKLDAFQMLWWKAARGHVEDNASAYIWGNAEDLWRLWYKGGLADSERLTLRNEVVWDKASGQGMESEQHRMFPTASERALFFMLGEQGFNNNADNYWEGWEPIRAYLKGEADEMGWAGKDIQRICGVGMYSHWFTESQWTFITREHYARLQQAAEGVTFRREYDELRREYRTPHSMPPVRILTTPMTT